MKIQEIIEIVDSYAKSIEIPISIYKDSKNIYTSISGQAVFMTLDKMYKRYRGEPFLWIDGLLMLSTIHDSQNNLDIILGPVKSQNTSSDVLRLVFSSHSILIFDQELKELSSFFFKQKIVMLQRFQSCANTLSLVINGSKISFVNTEKSLSAKDYLIESDEIEWSQYNSDMVKQIQYLVKNGLVDEMKAFFNTESPAPYGEMAFDDLRHYKNSMMVHIYIVRCAANEGGLNQELCLRLAESYSQQCELASTIDELTAISRRLRLDFCQRVHNLNKFETDSITINRAIRYIYEHRMEKLDADYISSALGISSPYLCSEFKSKTGLSIVTYIQQVKIDTAKQLLRNTDYSLSEIASYLSFSSQSYFQTVFKKVVGSTPLEYRNKKEL